MNQPAPHRPPAIVLAGPPGVGKTTLAHAAAAGLGRRAVDLDALLARRSGQPVPALVRAGEAQFRALEAETLAHLGPRPSLVALGGGTLTAAAGRHRARALGPVFGLSAPKGRLAARLEGSSAEDRPLLATGLDALLSARRQSYAAVDQILEADVGPQELGERLRGALDELSLTWATVGTHTTRILLGQNLAQAAVGAVAAVAPTRPVVVLVDRGVPQAGRAPYLEALRAWGPTVVLEVAGGEPVKTWAQVGASLEDATQAGAGRQSVVVGLGGGAVCDLAGLVASLLGRGTPLVLVPSTLLAQIDAAVGGKTAVNLATGRNLAGTFHPAEAVLIDEALLESLPADERRSGLAELFKIALISDRAFFEGLLAEGRATPALIRRAVEEKAHIVDADPYDQGGRQRLNLGHTLGHALETASAHRLRHGEAVAIGLAAVTRLSHERGWLASASARQILSGLEGLGLPTTASPELLAAAAPLVGRDKKGSASRISLITVHEVAKVAVTELSLDEAREGLIRNGGVR